MMVDIGFVKIVICD